MGTRRSCGSQVLPIKHRQFKSRAARKRLMGRAKSATSPGSPFAYSGWRSPTKGADDIEGYTRPHPEYQRP
jgi:hypothetical protein